METENCPHGHVYDAENTYTTKEGWRKCRICNNSKALRRKDPEEGGGDEWCTPDWLFEKAQDLCGTFDFDAAAQAHNAKCERWSNDSLGDDVDWGDSTFVNPPYSRGMIDQFITKAISEYQAGRNICMLLPSDTSTQWFRRLVEGGADIFFLTKRIKFKGASGSPKFGSIFAVFDELSGGEMSMHDVDGKEY